MRLGRLYLKIFLSFIVILILTEFLILGLFGLFAGRRFRDISERYTNAQGILMAELIKDQAALGPSRPISEDRDLQRLLQRLGEIYEAKVWIASADGRPLLKSFDGPPPQASRVGGWKGRRGPGQGRPGEFFFSVKLEREGHNLGRLNLFWDRFEEDSSMNFFPLGLLGIGGFIALLLIPISRRITNPIKELHRSALRIAEGDLTHRTDVKTKDEIGDLGYAFNRMTSEIERMIRGNKELTANISHELRSPLARIRMAEELIRKGLNGEGLSKGRGLSPGESRDALKYLDNIQEEIGELDSLIDQVLSLSRLDMSEKPFQMEKVNLEAVMVEVLQRMKALIEKNSMRIDSELAPGIPAVTADREAIKTALSNLMSNAIKFSPEGERLEVSIKPEGGGVRIKIANACDPIPEEDLKRIFDPFYRVEEGRREIQGTGLGLAITKRIIEGHGGIIEAVNIPGGLQFSIYLPINE